MVNAPGLNLVLVLVAALWLPAGPCCAIASAAVNNGASDTPVGDTSETNGDPASPVAPEDCAAPAPCGSHAPEAPGQDPGQPGEPSHPGGCDSADGCDCPRAMSAQCARNGADAPVAIASATPSIPTGAVDAALADLYPPTFPAGRLAIDAGRPEPTGTPTLFGLGCMLTT